MAEITTAFLSSTYKDMASYREKLRDQINSLDAYKCVCMEDFGARDCPSEDFCRARVRESDIFVGVLGHIYGAHTSDGRSYSEMEYATAVECGKTRLMFLASEDLPVVAHVLNSQTDADRASQRAFRARVQQDRVRATFQDADQLVREVLKALPQHHEGHSPESRAQVLGELRKASQARCVRRWVATGLPEQSAVAWSEDPDIGAPGAWLFGHILETRIVIAGDIGSGKSLIAERLHQMAIDSALSDPSAPIPVYLAEGSLRSGAADLKGVVRAASRGLGEPGVVGVALVLDGIDECGSDLAARALDGARDIALTWPNVRVVVTSRPMAELHHLTENETPLAVPPLSEDEACDLIGRSAGRRYDEYELLHLPQSVRESVLSPLFALLLGTFLKQRDAFAPESAADMVSYVVDRALRSVNASLSKAHPLLMKLGQECVSRNSGVPSAELGGRLQVQKLVDSRLVIEESGMLSFALPLFGEWFAAQALTHNTVSPDDLTGCSKIERWKTPLAVLAATSDIETVSRYLAPISEKYPPLAAEVVRDAIVKRTMPSRTELPPALECGRQLRAAMQAWANGLGPAAHLLAPVDEGGAVRPVGVHIEGDWLTVGWYYGNAGSADVIDLDWKPDSRSPMPAGYPVISSSSPAPQPSWAWRWTHDELAKRLADVLKARALPLETGPLAREAAWDTARHLCDLSALGPDRRIPLSVVEKEMSELDEFVTSERASGHMGPVYVGDLRQPYDPRVLRAEVQRLRAAGETHLPHPWPGPDVLPTRTQTAYTWHFYSRDCLLQQTRAVCAAALEAYGQLVEQWFPAFRYRLSTYALLPVRLVGALRAPDPAEGFAGAPALGWYFEALPRGSSNEVKIEYGSDIRPSKELFETLHRALQQHRPDEVWVRQSFRSEILPFHGDKPATDMAYHWLWDDLQAISWVEGMFNRR